MKQLKPISIIVFLSALFLLPAAAKAGTIFTSSFENTGFAEWTETVVVSPGSIVDSESSLVRDGSFAARSISSADNNRAGVFKSLSSSYATLAARIDIMVVSSGLPAYGHRDFFQFYEGTGWTSTVKFGARRFSDSAIYVAVWDEGPYGDENYLSDVWELGRWYTVEIMATQGQGTGLVEFWIDGVKKATLANRNTGDVPWQRFVVGNYAGEPGVVDMVIDNLIVSTEFIPFGGDTAPPSTTIVSVEGDTASPYVDASDDSDTQIIVNGESGMACRWYDADTAYTVSSGTACPVSGTQATCSVSTAAGSYTKYVSCADSVGNGQSTSNNLDVSWSVSLAIPNIRAAGVIGSASSTPPCNHIICSVQYVIVEIVWR